MSALAGGGAKRVEKIISLYESDIDTSIQIPAEEFSARQKKVQAALKERGLDVGLFFWYREMPGDGVYLTGYNPTIERASGLIGQEGAPLAIGGPEAGMIAREVAPRSGVEVAFAREFAIPDEYYEDVTYSELSDLIHAISGGNLGKVGLLTALDLLPEAILDVFKKAAGDGVEFVEADDILADLRYEKSKVEFACMEQADKIACAAVRGMLAIVEPGLRESQVAAVGDLVAKSLGADGYGFETIVTSGPRCRTIIGPATNRVIQEGEIVQIGCSPGYEAYKGISRRVVVMGKPTDRQKTYLGLVEEAYKRAEAALEKVVAEDLESRHVDLAPRMFYDQHEIDGENMKRFHTFSSAHGTGLTECLEPMVVGPDTKEHYGYRVGIMLDVGNYGHPNDEIAGGTVENAFGKEGTTLYKWSDLPAMVGDLVGAGI